MDHQIDPANSTRQFESDGKSHSNTNKSEREQKQNNTASIYGYEMK